MAHSFSIILGRLVQGLASLRGGGSALPGLVVEKVEPSFAASILNKLPAGVVLVSGTNGKTTTTKAISELLTGLGLKVFTNNTGSNFMRGVISALLRQVSLSGSLDADIAVLELDEAHAVSFSEIIRPRYTLLLNVMRDQLDRFGEIDYTARLLTAVARNTSTVVIINREDSRLAAIAQEANLDATVRWFGVANNLQSLLPNDDALYNGLELPSDTSHDDALLHAAPRDDDVLGSSPRVGHQAHNGAQTLDKAGQGQGKDNARALNIANNLNNTSHTVILSALTGSHASFELEGRHYSTKLALEGIYNVVNAAAALATVHAIVPQAPVDELVVALGRVRSAFGRGEVLEVQGRPLKLILVKNPGGFRLALKAHPAAGVLTMIAINDDYADGRDMSWLYDVGFQSLQAEGVAVVSGVRAFDMALRLCYDDVECATVLPNLSEALDELLAQKDNKPAHIYCTYTAMLRLRRLLAAKTDVPQVR
ncbi:MAG: MurT ligase domain-containing protein [Coriobacteriales bacterium]|nr:MurT ligase domain-containing protein [Coriobacteriales bacterium]